MLDHDATGCGGTAGGGDRSTDALRGYGSDPGWGGIDRQEEGGEDATIDLDGLAHGSATSGGTPGPDEACAATLGHGDVQEKAGALGPGVASPGAAPPGQGRPRRGLVGGRRTGAPRRRRSDPGGSIDRLAVEEGEDKRVDLDIHLLAPRPAPSEEEGVGSALAKGGTPGKDDGGRKGRGNRAPTWNRGGPDDEHPGGGREAPPPPRDVAEDAASPDAEPAKARSAPSLWSDSPELQASDAGLAEETEPYHVVPPGAYRIYPNIRSENSTGDRPPADDSEDAGPTPELQVSDATLVEEAEVYHGAPLVTRPTLWRQSRVRLLATALCAVVTALSIGFGLSLSTADGGAEVEEPGDSSAEVEEVVKGRSLPPPTLRPSPPTASSLPPLRSSIPAAPFITCSEAGVKRCFPKVAMDSDTAIVTRSWFDVQFFNNSSFELATRLKIDFWPESVALDGDTAVIVSRSFELVDGGFESLGSGDVYVYERDQHGSWSQAAQFRSGTLGMGHGFPVVIDGDIIVLGFVQRLNDLSNFHLSMPEERLSGYVHVYRRNGTAWTEEAKLTPPGNASANFFSGYVSVRGTSIAVGDYYYGSEGEGAVFVYELNPLSKSWIPVGEPLVNSDCSTYFGSIVRFTNGKGMLVNCGPYGSGANTIYYYEKHGVGEDYVLRQTIGFKDNVRLIDVDGEAMAVTEYRPAGSLVIHFFVQKNLAWEEVDTIVEPIVDDGSFGWHSHIALSGNSTMIASWENVYLVQDYYNS